MNPVSSVQVKSLYEVPFRVEGDKEEEMSQDSDYGDTETGKGKGKPGTKTFPGSFLAYWREAGENTDCLSLEH